MHKFCMFLALAGLFSACGRQPIEKFETVENMVWDYSSPHAFVVDIKDPGTYKLVLQLRYNQDYNFSNIWVGLTETKPDGSKENVRYNIPLFDITGRPFGSFAGKFYDRNFPDGEVDNSKLTLEFPKPGKYTLSLQHNMRGDKLPGIVEVGMRLQAVN